MTNHIAKRLTSRLNRDDREDIQAALLQYALDEELDPASLKANHYLLAKLLPILNQISTNWKGLARNVEWVGSSAHKHCLDHLKNCLRFKGKFLARQIAAAQKDDTETQPDQPEEDDVDTAQPTPQKDPHTKKREASEKDDTPIVTQPHATFKRQKVEQQDDDASYHAFNQAQVPQITPIKDTNSGVADIFIQLTKVSAQIKQKRYETAVLYQEW